MTDKLEDKIRKYRIVVSNAPLTDEGIRETVNEELGNVEVVDYDIESEYNFRGTIENGGDTLFPQRLIVVSLSYKEK